jgi:hypothetical protein
MVMTEEQDQLFHDAVGLLEFLCEKFNNDNASVAQLLSVALSFHLHAIKDEVTSLNTAHYLENAFANLFALSKGETVH